MAFRGILQAGVNQAFAIAGDLAVDVTLTKGGATGYDFETGEITSAGGGRATVRGILLAADKRSEDGNRASSTLILRKVDVPNIDVYDSFAIGRDQYRLSRYVDNGYTIEIEVSGG